MHRFATLLTFVTIMQPQLLNLLESAASQYPERVKVAENELQLIEAQPGFSMALLVCFPHLP
jgi:hypothetical protein